MCGNGRRVLKRINVFFDLFIVMGLRLMIKEIDVVLIKLSLFISNWIMLKHLFIFSKIVRRFNFIFSHYTFYNDLQSWVHCDINCQLALGFTIYMSSGVVVWCIWLNKYSQIFSNRRF